MKVWRSKEHAKYYLLGAYLSDGGNPSPSHPKRFSLGQRGLESREFTWIVISALSVLGISCTLSVGPPRNSDKFQYKVTTRRTPESKELIQWMVEGTGGIESENRKSTLPQIPSHLLPEVLASVLDGDGSLKGHQLLWYGKSQYVQALIPQLENLDVLIFPSRTPKRLTNFGKPKGPMREISLPSFFSAGLFLRMPYKLDRLIVRAKFYATGRGITSSGWTGKMKQEAATRWLAETLPLIPRSAKEYPIDRELVRIPSKHFHGWTDFLPPNSRPNLQRDG